MRERAMKIAILGLLICMGSAVSAKAWAFGPPRPTRCAPMGEWRTVDAYIPPTPSMEGFGLPNGAASSSKADFVVGSQSTTDDGRGYRWIVRRSLDRGETWSTSDVFYFFEGQDTEANGVAADLITDEVYVVGKTLWQYEAFPGAHWIVRKTSDNGATWRTVDDLRGARLGIPYVHSVSIASGVIYAGGTNIRSLEGIIPSEGLLRRSADGGATWTTINLGEHLQEVRSVAATSSGAVFVAGTGAPSNTSTGAWIVVHSPNGIDGWTVVDRLANGTEIMGSTAHTLSGRVVVYGVADGTTWTVRESAAAAPTVWRTIDSYRPEVIDGRGPAIAGAATYSKGENPITAGNLFVTGMEKHPLKTQTTHLTRRRHAPAGTVFGFSDRFDQPYSTGFIGNRNWAATTTYAGDILTAAVNPNPAGQGTWMVRKLTCQLPRSGD